MIKLADSSDSGWRVVKEYEAHPLADNEEDEKKIYRAQFMADKKLRQERRQRSFRFSPYGRRPFTPETTCHRAKHHHGISRYRAGDQALVFVVEDQGIDVTTAGLQQTTVIVWQIETYRQNLR
jgi:hypothetical protein